MRAYLFLLQTLRLRKTAVHTKRRALNKKIRSAILQAFIYFVSFPTLKIILFDIVLQEETASIG